MSVGIIRVDVFELGEVDLTVDISVELFNDDVEGDCAALAPLVTNGFSVLSRLLQSAFFDAMAFVAFLDLSGIQGLISVLVAVIEFFLCTVWPAAIEDVGSLVEHHSVLMSFELAIVVPVVKIKKDLRLMIDAFTPSAVGNLGCTQGVGDSAFSITVEVVAGNHLVGIQVAEALSVTLIESDTALSDTAVPIVNDFLSHGSVALSAGLPARTGDIVVLERVISISRFNARVLCSWGANLSMCYALIWRHAVWEWLAGGFIVALAEISEVGQSWLSRHGLAEGSILSNHPYGGVLSVTWSIEDAEMMSCFSMLESKALAFTAVGESSVTNLFTVGNRTFFACSWSIIDMVFSIGIGQFELLKVIMTLNTILFTITVVISW